MNLNNKKIIFSVNKLIANYSQTFHFKLKIQLKNSNEFCESKHSTKYEKNKTEININEILELNILNSSTINKDSILQFFLLIYTKTGYKSAGNANLEIINIKNNLINKIEILKCPLGKGIFEIKIDFPNDLINNDEESVKDDIVDLDINNSFNSDDKLSENQKIKQLKENVKNLQNEISNLYNVVGLLKNENLNLKDQNSLLLIDNNKIKKELTNIKKGENENNLNEINFNQKFFSGSSNDSNENNINNNPFNQKFFNNNNHTKNNENINNPSMNSSLEKYESFGSNNNNNINSNNNNNNNDNNNFIDFELDKLSVDFLETEFKKPHYHWIINSKEIKYIKPIASGGSSEVYLGDYRGTEVAVKKLRIKECKDDNLKEFKREVSSLSLLRQTNLVLFMGAIAEDNNICIVTEFCKGGTLFDLLYKNKNIYLTWSLRLKLLLEIAIGMNFLHTNNPPIIHRDLKSLNVLLTEKIEKSTDITKCKISDFGLSKFLENIDNKKLSGHLGTCHWMAPEVIENKNYSLKADVYSYGIIIWEVCCRKTPYYNMNQQQIQFYVTFKKGRPDMDLMPKDRPKEIDKLIECCWDHNPNNRPTFSQIIEYIKNIKLK